MVRLAYKIASTHMLVIAVVMITIIISAGITAPAALNRHIKAMEEHVGTDNHLIENLESSFKLALRETITFYLIISTVIALITALALSRKVVTPLRALREASRRIAEGQFKMRVDESGNDELADLAHCFNVMARELDTTETRRLDLIGDVAHELRTPLSCIISIAEAVSDEVLPATPETFGDIISETNRMKRLVNDLEELSRLSGNDIVIQKSNINLELLVSDIVRRVSPQFEGKSLDIIFEAKSSDNPSDNLINTDSNRLTQVLHNLLNNALRYTPVYGKVFVRLFRQDDNFIIEVQDSGAGIREPELKKIFERFYRVDPSRNRSSGGSGIGLAVSLRLTNLLGGSLTASSPGPDKGSTFTVRLPRGL